MPGAGFCSHLNALGPAPLTASVSRIRSRMKKKYKVTWESFVFLPAIFVGLSVLTIQNLARLERGKSVMVAWFTVPMYKLLGYWPHALLFPALGVACLVALIAVYFNERRDHKDDG